MMGKLAEYLATLPGGVDAYPDHTQKASAYRAILDDLPGAEIATALPPPLKYLVTHPEPVSAWIPEVHVNAFFLAAIDTVLGSEAAFLDRYEKMNEHLLSGPLYRMMMLVASPGIIVRGAASRWASFHRGVPIHTESEGSSGVTVSLTWPPRLYTRVLAESFGRAFLVALRLAGAKDVAMTLTDFDETGGTYHGTWR